LSLPDDATGDALRRLVADGSDLGKPLVMDFFVAVPTAEVGNAVAARAQKLGFNTQVDQDEEDRDWTCTCTCTKQLIPSYENVTEQERVLDELAKPLGGFIDGFGSFGNAE